jgi:N-methylhydantoinase B
VKPDPIILQIVEVTLASAEAEVEAAIERTARSPMIRDQHDYRGGIHDRHCRKLTGRSYSALVQPIVRDFPIETIEEGDVFFHNDVYRSAGGIGHLPDMCVTVPVHDEGKVVAFVQAFGHHDDIGGATPGSMPAHATSYYQEGLIVPPVKLYDRGRPNRDVHTVMVRNSRLPDSLAGDLDSEVNACRMGAERIADLFRRYGQEQVEACFQAIVDRCRDTFRNEILPKIPDGVYEWEDYVEHDGVDPPRLHTIRLKMTKTPEKVILDLNGTSPQAKGPINHVGDPSNGGVFLKKWIAIALRNLAESPERAAEIDVNEGVCEVIDIVFPPPGTLVTPIFPAPVNSRTFFILRLIGVFIGAIAKAVGGRMPADQETIRYTGVHGFDRDGRFFLMREVLGGGAGGRWYADGSDVVHIVPGSRNLPAEFAETRFPLLVEKLALKTDSGGPGKRRGGQGYDKLFRVLQDAYVLSTADRSILRCYGIAGGQAGGPFQVTINPGRPDERTVDAMADDAPVKEGDLWSITTTGGGGWGDPLDREPDMVLRDILQGRVSPEAAARDYGVIVAGSGDDRHIDEPATETLRSRLRAERGPLPMFDRGPRYGELANGKATAEVDWT